MGFHVSWIATRGKPADAVRAGLGLRETSGREELPESEITGLLLPSGWYVVVFNDVPGALDDSALRRLSSNCELLAFVVEEASMVSKAHGFENGKRIWSVMHGPDKGPAHLEIAPVRAETDALLASLVSQWFAAVPTFTGKLGDGDCGRGSGRYNAWSPPQGDG